MVNEVLTIKDGIVTYCRNDVVDVIIPKSVTKIDDWAFAGCKSLKSVAIPKSVTEIGEGAFRD